MTEETPATLQLPHCLIDFERSQIVRADDVVSMTPREVRLLLYMVERSGQTVGQAELLEQVWDYNPKVASRAVTHGVSRLRKKLEIDPKKPQILVNSRGSGYRLEVPVAAPSVVRPLPATSGPFLGRSDDVERVRTLLASYRLVSVCGPGGVGKSRLSLEIARAWSDPVVYCPLTGVSDAEGCRRRFADALDFSFQSGGIEEQQVALLGALRARGRLLVVLDCFDDLVEPARDTLERWVSGAPDVHFLVSSRERLGLMGEGVHDLQGLSIDAARALFLTVAGATSSAFQPDPEAGVVDEIVARVDHLPLAIELVASQVHVQSVPALLQSIKAQPLDISRRDGTSMRQALDASWETLPEADRSRLAQFSVFTGGVSLDGAAALWELEPAQALEAMAELRNRSLLRVDPSRERFALYDTVRAYASDKLVGAARRQAEEAHAQLMVEVDGHVATEPVENLLLVQRRFAATHPQLAARALLQLEQHDRHWASQHLDLLRATVAGGELAVDTMLGLQVKLVRVLLDKGLAKESLSRLETLIPKLEAHGEPSLVLLALRALGQARSDLSDPVGAINAFEQALTLAVAAEDVMEQARVHAAIATVHSRERRITLAKEHYTRAVALLQGRGQDGQVGKFLARMSILTQQMGQPREALALLRRAANYQRLSGDAGELAIVWGYQGGVYFDLGRFDEAASSYRDALRAHTRLGHDVWCALWEGNLSAVLLELGELEQALQHSECALSWYKALNDPVNHATHQLNRSMIQLHRGRLDEAEDAAHECLVGGIELSRSFLECAARIALGLLSLERGRWRAAEQSLEQALAVGPRRTGEICCWLALSGLLRGDLARTARWLQQAEGWFAEHPDDAARTLCITCSAGLRALEADVSEPPRLCEDLSTASSEVRLAVRWLSPLFSED